MTSKTIERKLLAAFAPREPEIEILRYREDGTWTLATDIQGVGVAEALPIVTKVFTEAGYTNVEPVEFDGLDPALNARIYSTKEK